MKRVFYLFIFLILIFTTAIFFPRFIFLKNYKCSDNIKVYSYNLPSNELCRLFNDCFEKLNVENKVEIFIFPSNIYKILFFYHHSSVFFNPFTLSVYVKENTDFDNQSIRFELSKTFLYSKLALKIPVLSLITMPSWKIVGYLKYILSEPENFDVSDICKDSVYEKSGYMEFENRMVFEYLIKVRNYSPENILNYNLSYSYYLEEAKRFYCK